MRASFDELSAFVSVADLGGFTAAARRLGLSTNAVSLRVRNLETAVGVSLFTRSTRRVVLTDEGRGFYERVTGALGELETAEEALRARTSGLGGTVRIALPAPLASAGLLSRLGALLAEHPDLRVQMLVTGAPGHPLAAGVDIAVCVGALPDSTFVSRFLARPAWVLVAVPAYIARYGAPDKPSDLTAHRCLRFWHGRSQELWTLVDRRGIQVTVPVAGGFECDDSRVLGDAAYAGLGIGIRPASECAEATRAGRLVRVLPRYSFQPLDVHAVLARGAARLPRVAACLAMLSTAIDDVA